MKFICSLIAIVLIVACSDAGYAPLIALPGPTTLVRTPHHDSAIVHSDQLGGNFAYSVHEGHAYQALTPYYHHQPQIVTYQWSDYPQIYIQHPQWVGTVAGYPSVVHHGIVPGIATQAPAPAPASPSDGDTDVVEVESPAGSDVDQPSSSSDSDENEPLQSAKDTDDDSVSVESA